MEAGSSARRQADSGAVAAALRRAPKRRSRHRDCPRIRSRIPAWATDSGGQPAERTPRYGVRGGAEGGLQAARNASGLQQRSKSAHRRHSASSPRRLSRVLPERRRSAAVRDSPRQGGTGLRQPWRLSQLMQSRVTGGQLSRDDMRSSTAPRGRPRRTPRSVPRPRPGRRSKAPQVEQVSRGRRAREPRIARPQLRLR